MRFLKVGAIALLALLSAIALVEAIHGAEEMLRTNVAHQQAL